MSACSTHACALRHASCHAPAGPGVGHALGLSSCSPLMTSTLDFSRPSCPSLASSGSTPCGSQTLLERPNLRVTDWISCHGTVVPAVTSRRSPWWLGKDLSLTRLEEGDAGGPPGPWASNSGLPTPLYASQGVWGPLWRRPSPHHAGGGRPHALPCAPRCTPADPEAALGLIGCSHAVLTTGRPCRW